MVSRRVVAVFARVELLGKHSGRDTRGAGLRPLASRAGREPPGQPCRRHRAPPRGTAAREVAGGGGPRLGTELGCWGLGRVGL